MISEKKIIFLKNRLTEPIFGPVNRNRKTEGTGFRLKPKTEKPESSVFGPVNRNRKPTTLFGTFQYHPMYTAMFCYVLKITELYFRWQNRWNKHINSKTSFNISELKRNVKLKDFELNINESFDPPAFCKFLKVQSFIYFI